MVLRYCFLKEGIASEWTKRPGQRAIGKTSGQQLIILSSALTTSRLLIVFTAFGVLYNWHLGEMLLFTLYTWQKQFPRAQSVSLRKKQAGNSQAWGQPYCHRLQNYPAPRFSAWLFWSLLLASPSPVVHVQRSISRGNHTCKQNNNAY